MSEENNNFKESHCEDKGKNTFWCSVKFALLLLAVFLATYLAVYYISDQIRHSHYWPTSAIEDIDKIIKEQDKIFNDSKALPLHDSAHKGVNNPVVTYKDTDSNSYKMVINLKPFDDNPKNIDISVKDNIVTVKGANEKIGKNSEKVYVFTESYDLPENIDEEKITKEQVKNNYIVTMPIEIDD